MELAELAKDFNFSGRVAQVVPAFLLHHGCENTALHVAAVAQAARSLALRFDVDPQAAEDGGWLHDISAAMPVSEYIQTARQLGLDVLAEEEAYPRILHQRLSAEMARQLFHVQDEDLLNAIRHHTTLRANASRLEMVVFTADKLAWDQPYQQPFLAELQAGLDLSLEAGTLAYLDDLWQRRDTLRCVHPWMVAAREWLHPVVNDQRRTSAGNR